MAEDGNQADLPSSGRDSVDEVVDQAAAASAAVQHHPAYRYLVTVGLYCYGAVHLLLAFLALEVLRGHRVDASNQGALATVAQWPMGRLLLAVIGVGMAALALWMVLQTAFGYRWLGGRKRLVRQVSCAFRAVAYASIGWGALQVARGGRLPSGDRATQQAARPLLGLPGGTWLLLLVALGVAVAAVDQVQRGVRRSFVRYDLQLPLPVWGERLGVVG